MLNVYERFQNGAAVALLSGLSLLTGSKPADKPVAATPLKPDSSLTAKAPECTTCGEPVSTALRNESLSEKGGSRGSEAYVLEMQSRQADLQWKHSDKNDGIQHGTLTPVFFGPSNPKTRYDNTLMGSSFPVQKSDADGFLALSENGRYAVKRFREEAAGSWVTEVMVPSKQHQGLAGTCRIEDGVASFYTSKEFLDSPSNPETHPLLGAAAMAKVDAEVNKIQQSKGGYITVSPSLRGLIGDAARSSNECGVDLN